MNCRTLLTLLGLTPFAAPGAGAATPARMATGGYVGRLSRSYVVGEAPPGSFVPLRPTSVVVSNEIHEASGQILLRFSVGSTGFVDGDGI